VLELVKAFVAFLEFLNAKPKVTPLQFIEYLGEIDPTTLGQVIAQISFSEFDLVEGKAVRRGFKASGFYSGAELSSGEESDTVLEGLPDRPLAGLTTYLASLSTSDRVTLHRRLGVSIRSHGLFFG
jgi:hypothetical protein